jgi:hypothetical protein
MVSCALALAIVAQAFGLITAQALDYVAMASVFWVVFAALTGLRIGMALAVLVASAVVGLLLWMQGQISGLRYMPFVLIVPANIMMGVIFARGLMTDRQPILVQLIELMNLRPLDDSFQRFVERQCLLWSVMCFATAGVALGAMILPVWRIEFSYVLTALVIAQVGWFALSHYYAQIRYQRPETWWLTFKMMLRPGVWARLRV